MRITDNINGLYPALINHILLTGDSDSVPRGRRVKEIYNYSFKLKHAENSIILTKARKLNYAYAAIEMLGLFRHGSKNVEPFTWYIPNMKKYLNEKTQEFDGSYATRITIYDQLREVYKILKADPDSRRAIITFYNPAHDFHDYESLDICCTLNLIFSIRRGKLHLACTIRSNDIFLGLPYDLTQFTFLQSVLACWLGVEIGTYCHFAANLHAYEDDTDRLKRIVEERGLFTEEEVKWREMPKWDISTPDQTYEEIEEFFKLEKELRKGASQTDLNRLWPLYKISSKFLYFVAHDIILPYLIRQSNKIK